MVDVLKAETAAATALASVALLLLPVAPAVAETSGDDAALTTEEALGRQIFFAGEGEAGREITAVLGEGGTEVPASALPCASCHGEDGRGRPEGGLNPSDVTWPALTKPYGSKHPGGREHPPYTADLVKRAVTMGLDAGGNRLHVAMPRYQLTHAEASAVTAFLERLGHELDPGIDEASVRIGVVLPPAAGTGELGQAIRAVLEAAGTGVGEVPWTAIEAIAYPPGRLDPRPLVRRELGIGTDAVFFLGPALEAAALLAAAAELDWTPHCFLLGPMAGAAVADVAPSFAERIFFSFATLPIDTSPKAYARYRALASSHGLPAEHLASQLAALAAFELLVEALERTGRDLSREKLIASLEGLYRYPGAFTPALTYGPNRRIGALGAYVVAPDLENKRFMARGEWITLR